MAKTTRKLGRLSLAILENFVESKLGKDFVDELRRPSKRAGAIRQALEKTEERFKAEYKDRDLSKAMFVDLSQKDYPPLKEAIGKFYDHPTDPGFSSPLHEILLGEFEALAEERVNRAVDRYLELLTEELALVDETFRENARTLADLRMVPILRRVEILLAQKPQQPEIAAFRALHQLPSPPADSTGREEELKQLLAGLSAGRAAAISGLTGLGGIGKTALGLVVAYKLADQFPDAQIFIDLKGAAKTANPLTPAEAMRHAILSFEPTADLRQVNETQLAALYQSVLNGRKVLLFLDNARSAEQVRPLLPPETCCALVTSRWNFVLPGLQLLLLDVLPEAEAIGFLLTLCARIGGSSTLTVAAEIAKLCGYLPLALRIAGNFLTENKNWEPQEYAIRLSDRRERLKTLKAPDDPTLDLEAAFELSYQHLTTSATPPSLVGKGVGGLGQAAAWRALAVFPASFRREAAAAVWEMEESPARELLSKLHRMSLLDYLKPSPPEGGRGQGEGGGGRFSLHDLLADFALARMNEEETFVARLRHAQHYMNVMGQADALYLKGGESILQGLKSFDDEWAHIQAGQAWAAENTKMGSETAELAMLYPDAGVYCLDLRLTPQQRIGWLTAALEAARALGRKDAEGAHLGNLGIAYKNLGDARKAIGFYEQQLVIAREIGDRRGEGNALGNLGNTYANLGDARKAIQFYEQRLEIAREIGDRRGEALGIWNLGLAYEQLGDLAKAIKAMQVCVDFEREIGHPDAEKDAAKVAELKQKL